jgi:hypothetical protein
MGTSATEGLGPASRRYLGGGVNRWLLTSAAGTVGHVTQLLKAAAQLPLLAAQVLISAAQVLISAAQVLISAAQVLKSAAQVLTTTAVNLLLLMF